MQAVEHLTAKRNGIEAFSRKYWDPVSSDFDFLAEFGPPVGMNAFDQSMGLVVDLEALLGHAERSAKDLYAA